MNAALSVSLLIAFLTIQVCSAQAEDDVIRRRDSLALFRGFLCYIKGDTLEECQRDRAVLNIIRHLEDKQAADVPKRMNTKSVGLDETRLPLPPQDPRKRDAFYSDWKRK